MNKEKLGQVLLPTRGEVNKMVQWILKYNRKVVPLRSPRQLQVEDIHSTTEQKKRELFCRLIEGRWVTLVNVPPTSSDTKNENQFLVIT